MDRTSFLQSLPYLYHIPQSTTIPIWKQHRAKIVQYCHASIRKTAKNEIQVEEEMNDANKLSLAKLHHVVQSLFSLNNHVVSIEPKTHHHNERKGGSNPSFFLCSNNDAHPSSDPSVVEFSALLLPAEIHDRHKHPIQNPHHGEQFQSPAKKEKGERNKKKRKLASPVLSISTTMSTPGENGIGGKFENDHDSEGDHDDGDDVAGLKTNLLYFVFSRRTNDLSKTDVMVGDKDSKEQNNESFDIFFVDHQSVESIEIEGTTPMKNKGDGIDNDKEENANSSTLNSGVSTSTCLKQKSVCRRKPSSLLINFQSCSFRIFAKEFLLPMNINHNTTTATTTTTTTTTQNKQHAWDNENFMAEYTNDLRAKFEKVKSCILQHKENMFKFHLQYHSFYSYLTMMSDAAAEDDSSCNHENAQIEKAPTTDEDTTSKSNSINMENNDIESSASKPNSNELSSISTSTTKRKRRSYEKSWDALEKIHSALNSSSNMNYLQYNKQFCTVIKTCAIELSNSYMVENTMDDNESQELHSKEKELHQIDTTLSGIQHEIDDKIRKMFPSSTGGRTKSLKMSQEAMVKAQEELEKQLKEYRKKITAKHLLTCLPSR